MRTIRLGVGERVEILVDVSDKRVIELQNQQRGGMMGGGSAMTIMTIDARQAQPSTHPIPTKLRAINGIPDLKSVIITRQFGLQMSMGMMTGGGFRINGQSMDPARIDFQVKRNSTEIWEVRNDSFMPHPFHVHGVQFHILDRNGKQPLSDESGLKDTVLIQSAEAVRLIMTFPDYSDTKIPYMYHCHNLEHEDQGMMGQFLVI